MQTEKKKKNKSGFKRVVEFLHLWLGLISGIVLLAVCFTAAIWVFRDEISYFTMPEASVAQQQQAYLPPSILLSKGKAYLQQQGKDTSVIKMLQVSYHQPGAAASLEYEIKQDVYGVMLINPYTGNITYEGEGETRTEKFFTFLRAGHRFFWLPQKIGSPFVGSSCLVFLIILITGLIWWYPKKWNDSTRKKSFKISWKANWKRVNIDLHNVLGFYAFLVAFILAFTGVTFSFDWFNNTYHRLITGQPYKEEEFRVDSEKPLPALTSDIPMDKLWAQYAGYIRSGSNTVSIFYPQDSTDSWMIMIRPTLGRIANMVRYYHDQHSGKLLKKSEDYNKMPAGEKLYNLTFDIHVATIWGLPSKIIASFTCLIGASLPVTGFIIWYNRKFGKKKKKEESTVTR